MRIEPATIFIDQFFSLDQAFTLYMAPETGRVDLISKNKCIYFLTIEKGYEVLYDGETNVAIGKVRHMQNDVKFTSQKKRHNVVHSELSRNKRPVCDEQAIA